MARIVLVLVALAGTAPTLASGVWLFSHYRAEALCSAVRPLESGAEALSRLRAVRLHGASQVATLVVTVAVFALAGAWAWDAAISSARRALLLAALCGLLLPSAALAVFTGRAVPWHALEPTVMLGELSDVTVLPGRSNEEMGGPAWCAAHAGEVERIRLGRMAHAAFGGLGAALVLAALPFAARYRPRRRSG